MVKVCIPAALSRFFRGEDGGLTQEYVLLLAAGALTGLGIAAAVASGSFSLGEKSSDCIGTDYSGKKDPTLVEYMTEGKKENC